MKSKVDKIGEVFARRVRREVRFVALELYQLGNVAAAEAMIRRADMIGARMANLDTYERLEVQDIIRGHKRAWPE